VKTLRARLVLSHLLPMLVVVPLMGIALINFLETRVLLPGFLQAYSGNAALVAEITQDQYRIWTDPVYAQTILARVSPQLSARVMLFTADGRQLASTDPTDLSNIGSFLDDPSLKTARGGQPVKTFYYNPRLTGDALDIWEPVIDPNLGVIGIVRITYLFASIADQFVQLRSLIAGVLLLGLLFGGILGLTLAVNIDTPLRKATSAVYQLAHGERIDRLPEAGPSELKRLAGAFNFLRDRLTFLEDSRRHLLANLVHELGRPLGALRSGVQALMKGATQDPQLTGELLSGMDTELARLQSLLTELTHLYDQILGSLELDLKPLQLSQWLAETLAPWQVSAKEKALDWRTNIPPDLPEVKADAMRLGQAVGNLVSNAIKFTPSGGVIELSAGVSPGALGDEEYIRVCDSGPGIPAEEQARVFDPFYRGSQGRRFVEGMGLGLSIAYDLVKAHGGRLELDSSPEKGSTLTIFLPLG
jgi:signal transduction histidine kinase